MHKVIKISGKCIIWVVLFFLLMPLFLSLLLAVPVVQNFVVDRLTSFASHHIGTTVDIESVDIGFAGKIKINGIYVEDMQRDTLLYAGRLEGYLPYLGMTGDGLRFSYARARDVKLFLRETPDGEMNIRAVVQRISNPNRKKKGKFFLELNDASLEQMELLIERQQHRNPVYGVDYGNMRFEHICIDMNKFVIDGQVIRADVGAMSFTEQSGFVLEDLNGKFILSNSIIGFADTRLKMPHSDLTINELAIVGNAWSEYRDYVSKVRMWVSVKGSVATDDIAYFSPSLRRWQTRLTDAYVEMEGPVDNFEAVIHSATIGDRTQIKASGRVQGLPDFKHATYDLRIPSIRTRASDIARLSRNIAGVKLSPSVRSMLRRAEQISMAGSFRGSLADFEAQMGVSCPLGSANIEATMDPDKGITTNTSTVQPASRATTKAAPFSGNFRASLDSRGFRLGRLLAKEPLVGRTNVNATFYSLPKGGSTEHYVMCDVTGLEFNDYTYDTLRVAGRLRGKGFFGRVKSLDDNLQVQADGSFLWQDSIPYYDLTAKLNKVDLAKLHFNRRDSVSNLSARVVAKAGGRSLDDLNGRIQISNATYNYNDKQIKARSISVRGENSANSKFIELHSDFVDATYRSHTNYRDIYNYLRRAAWRYLPLIGSDEDAPWQLSSDVALPDDYSLLDVKINRFNAISDAISAGLQVADSSTLNLMFNPASDRLSFKVSAPYIERNNMLATRLKINASNHNDSLRMYLASEDLYVGTIHLPQFSLTGGAKLGRVQLSAGFSDTTRRASGRIGFEAALAEQGGPNGRTVNVRLNSSYLQMGNQTWQINARGIRIDTAQMVVDRFVMRSANQRLLLDGVASRKATDSLSLELTNFQMGPFLSVANRLGYTVKGRANGRALMTAALGHGIMTADVAIDSLSANGVVAPPLHLSSRWDVKLKRAGLGVVNDRTRDTLLRGFYAPADRRYYARLQTDGLDMALLNPILSGVVSDTKGTGNVDLVLRGQGRDANLSGNIHVRDMSTTVDFTQVGYTMPEAVVKVENNRFTAERVPIFDPEGNRGTFALELDMQHLSNIAYEVRVEPTRMLVLNTTSEDNDLFYGTIYASGTARVRGNKGEVQMDIRATSEDNSSFYMPLSDKANISNAEFVTFVKPQTAVLNDQIAERKARFERGKRGKSPTQSRMSIDLEMTVKPNVEVEMMVSGSPIKARGEGLLTLDIEPQSNVFNMYGDYMIREGSYNFSLQNIISKQFEIEQGSMIQWTGDPIDARLSIEALYKVKTSLQPLLEGTADKVTVDHSVPVECRIHIGERLTNPSITFDVQVPDADPETQAVIATALSTPESVDLQFLYLIIFNNFMSESNGLGTAGMGSSASAASGLEFLSNQLSRLLSINDYNLVIRYRPKTDMTSDEVDFGLSKSLINNRLYVELEGNYLIDNKQAIDNSMSNFMGEAYITYLVDRSGALRLKAFTQTIDRFDENQGLQETGVGISYREDFDNLRDLRRRIKERFSSKRRRQRLEEERRQQENEAHEANRAAQSTPQGSQPRSAAPAKQE